MEKKDSKTVLIIDDDNTIILILREMLIVNGYKVITPPTIERSDVLTTILNSYYDLAILDISMPNISGIEICSIIKKKYLNTIHYIPVIFLTAHSDDEVMMKSFEAGGDDYLIKPFKHKELIFKLKALLRIKELNETVTRQKILREKMVYTIVHELRSPLSAIITSNDSMMVNINDMLEDEKILYISAIAEESERMMQIINKMLEIGKYDSNKIDLSLEQINIVGLVTKSYTSMKQSALKKNIELKLEITDFKLMSLCDSEKIEQVIYNLLSNAIKFTPSNGHIAFGAASDGDYIRVYVKDNGLGIKEEEMDNLFQEFSQLSARPTGGESSTGLGLAISRRIINAHRGKISVESEWGKGSTFYFLLPV